MLTLTQLSSVRMFVGISNLDTLASIYAGGMQVLMGTPRHWLGPNEVYAYRNEEINTGNRAVMY